MVNIRPPRPPNNSSLPWNPPLVGITHVYQVWYRTHCYSYIIQSCKVEKVKVLGTTFPIRSDRLAIYSPRPNLQMPSWWFIVWPIIWNFKSIHKKVDLNRFDLKRRALTRGTFILMIRRFVLLSWVASLFLVELSVFACTNNVFLFLALIACVASPPGGHDPVAYPSCPINSLRSLVLSSPWTVLSTQRHPYTQCPCWFFILERYHGTNYVVTDWERKTKTTAINQGKASEMLAYLERGHNKSS